MTPTRASPKRQRDSSSLNASLLYGKLLPRVCCASLSLAAHSADSVPRISTATQGSRTRSEPLRRPSITTDAFDFYVEQQSDQPILRVRGPVDAAAVAELQAQLALSTAPGASDLGLDLTSPSCPDVTAVAGEQDIA